MVDKLLKKHAKNFVTAERHDGKLEGIHYHENGSIYVTNSHTLLALHDVHKEESHTIHYKTGKEMDIKYPEVQRLLDNDYNENFTLNMNELRKYIDLIKISNEIDKVGDLIIENGNLSFKVEFNNESFELTLLGSVDKDDSVITTLNVMYFHNMLQFFKDAKVDKITFSYIGKFRPLSFHSGNYEILILPVRRY